MEEGLWEDPVTDEITSRYLKPMKKSNIDTLILGCTHYPLIRSTIRRLMGDGVTLVNPAYETAVSLRRLLKQEGIYRNSGIPEYHFYVSDGAEKIQFLANSILPVKLVETQLVPIDEY